MRTQKTYPCEGYGPLCHRPDRPDHHHRPYRPDHHHRPDRPDHLHRPDRQGLMPKSCNCQH